MNSLVETVRPLRMWLVSSMCAMSKFIGIDKVLARY
jgi:hypothetical protein